MKIVTSRLHTSWLADFVVDSEERTIATKVIVPVDVTLQHNLTNNQKSKTKNKTKSKNGNEEDEDKAEEYGTRTWVAIVDKEEDGGENLFGTLAASQFDIDYSFKKNTISYQMQGDDLHDLEKSKFHKSQMLKLPNMYPKGHRKRTGKEWKSYAQLKKAAAAKEKAKNKKKKTKSMINVPTARWLLYPRR